MSKETRQRWANRKPLQSPSLQQATVPDPRVSLASGQTDIRPRVNVSGSGTVRQTGHTFHLEPHSTFRVTVPASWRIVETLSKDGTLICIFAPRTKPDSGDDSKPQLPLLDGGDKAFKFECPCCHIKYSSYFDGNDCVCGVINLCHECIKPHEQHKEVVSEPVKTPIHEGFVDDYPVPIDECTLSYLCARYPYCDCPQSGDERSSTAELRASRLEAST